MTELVEYDEGGGVEAGALGELATIRNAGHFGLNADQSGYAKQTIEAFLTPGEDVFMALLRCVLHEEQVEPAARMLEEAMWLQNEAEPGSLPEGAAALMKLPYGARKVIVTGMLNASVEGRARRETAQVLTHGQANIGGPVGGTFKRAAGGVRSFLSGKRKGRLAA